MWWSTQDSYWQLWWLTQLRVLRAFYWWQDQGQACASEKSFYNGLVAWSWWVHFTIGLDRYHKLRLFLFPENPDYQHIRSLNKSEVMRYTQGSRPHDSWTVCGTLLARHIQNLSHKNTRMLPSTEHFQPHFHQETSWKVFLYTAIKGKAARCLPTREKLITLFYAE